MEEVWKEIKGYEGLYQVSNLGRVKSLPKLKCNKYGMFITKEHILKHGIAGGGYHFVGLHRDGKRKQFFVHRLVYEAFKGEIPDCYEINHIDECKNNNAIDNLNLMTPKENINWGTARERAGIKHRKKVVMDDEIEFDSMTKAAKYLGCGVSDISHCCTKRIRSIYGHRFRYK